MKTVLISGILAVLLTGCGADDEDGKSCSVSNELIVCPDGTKTELPKGSGVVDEKTIPHVDYDLCSDSDTFCSFGGGQIIYFDDGSVFVSGTYSYAYYSVYDSDSAQSTMSQFIPKDYSLGYIRLYFLHQYYNEIGAIFLVYDKGSDKALLAFDSDDSGDYSDNDSVITTLYPH